MPKVNVDDFTFEKLSNYIPDDDLVKLEIMVTSGLEKPWIIETLLYYLSDENPALTMYEINTIKTLVELAIRFYDASWCVYLDISNGTIKLDKLLEHTKQSRYCIDAANGRRVATSREVENGVVKMIGGQLISLIDDPVLKINDKEEAFLNLFTWAVTGYWRYYMRAGYKCEYDASGNLAEPEIKYILKISKVILRMCELLDQNYFDTIETKIKQIKKAGEYKYPEYASDEITMDSNESITFIVNQLQKGLPKYKTSAQLKCVKLLKSVKAGRYKFNTDEKILLRTAYLEMVNPTEESRNKNKDDDKHREEIKSLCDKIRQGVADGCLSSNDFAVKIVGTLSKYNYRSISEKQKAIIIESINKIELKRNNKNKPNSETENSDTANIPDTDDFGLASLSDLLGRGELMDGV